MIIIINIITDASGKFETTGIFKILMELIIVYSYYTVYIRSMPINMDSSVYYNVKPIVKRFTSIWKLTRGKQYACVFLHTWEPCRNSSSSSSRVFNWPHTSS